MVIFMKRIIAIAIVGILLLLGSRTPKSDAMEGLDGPVKPVANYDTKETAVYTEDGIEADVLFEYTTPDGICTIKVTEAYYDVTLDEEKATPYQAGLAYGRAIKEVYPSYCTDLEPYIHENIRYAFPNVKDDFSPVTKRLDSLFNSINGDYQQEIKGLADGLGLKNLGIKKDGILSRQELLTGQMLPDALRQTACSGLSLWGEKTITGDMLAVRCIEWQLGSDNTMCKIHSVLHLKNGEKSIASIGFLGFLEVVSGINNDGVFGAILDVDTGQEYDFEGKTCYTYSLRKALEEYNTAKDVGEYMVSNSDRFTYSHNIMVTDGNESYCAEDAVLKIKEKGKGYSVLRDNKTSMMKDVKWESPDSFCIINSFVTENNYDIMSGFLPNVARFVKYNEWVKNTDKFDVVELKNTMTQEQVETDLYGSPVIYNVHKDDLTQMILIDYHQGSVQVVFTGLDGVEDKPVFYQVEKFK